MPLVVCATPIGNLEDISVRLRDELMNADIVFAEDTRRTSKLLNHIGAKPKLRSLFVGNEAARATEVVEAVRAGSAVVLVSDAGMPTVSDPGASVVRAVRDAGGQVSVVPGPSAVTSALAASGFGGDRFVFEGFLPRKGTERSRRLREIAIEERTVVFFASPNRLAKDLQDLLEHAGHDRQIVIARELTKLHEEIWSGTLGDAAEAWKDNTKGEITIVIAGVPPAGPDLDHAVAEAASLVKEGVSHSEAARAVAESSGVSRREVYEALLHQDAN